MVGRPTRAASAPTATPGRGAGGRTQAQAPAMSPTTSPPPEPASPSTARDRGTGTEMPVEDQQCDLVVTRVVDVQVGQVWRAWTDPKLVRRWWGPVGFSCPLARMDLREGGTSLAAMLPGGTGPLQHLRLPPRRGAAAVGVRPELRRPGRQHDHPGRHRAAPGAPSGRAPPGHLPF